MVHVFPHVRSFTCWEPQFDLVRKKFEQVLAVLTVLAVFSRFDSFDSLRRFNSFRRFNNFDIFHSFDNFENTVVLSTPNSYAFSFKKAP